MNIKELKERDPRRFDKLYEEWREHEPYDGWTESIYEMAVEEGEKRGFMIDVSAVQRAGKIVRSDPCIYWSGFWSQGDGASWVGHVDIPKWIEWMRAPRAEELDRGPCKPGNGTPFTDAQLLYIDEAYRNDLLEARMHISARGNYSHSGMMCNEEDSIWCSWGSLDHVDEGVFAGMHMDAFVTAFTEVVGESEPHNEVLSAARAFADEIYKCLEEEYEYLTSEEQFIETNEEEYEDDEDPEA